MLKSLGASGTGIMGIFLGYGLSLGVVGSGVGMVMGLLFVRYINQIADVLSWVTGQRVFDPSIYYFYRIPDDRQSQDHRLDRAGRPGHRRVGQHPAGHSCRAAAPRGGVAL